MELGKNILIRCREKGLTVSKLAKLSNVKQPTLHGWTTGRAVKNINDLKRVCTILEIGIHEILFGSSDPFENKPVVFEKLFSGEIRITISQGSKEKGKYK